MYIYFPQNIYATRQKNPTRHFLIQGILLQCLDCTSNFGDFSSQEANVESWSTAASAKRPKPPQSCREPRWWPLLGYVGVETPQKQLFFLMLFVILVVEKMHIPAYFPNDILIFCWENDKPLDIGAPCFQTSQNLSNANQYTHTDTHTHANTCCTRTCTHTHTYCF